MADIQPLLDLFASALAGEHYSESVTQRDHALQCAGLAVGAGAADGLVAGALLHDVGHLLTVEQAQTGLRAHADLQHEVVGARHLRRWFGPEVTAPVVLHVTAKRYLCAVDPDYQGTLSSASVHSLGLQGGPMTAAECRAFEHRAGWEDAILLRRWDDAAKVVGAECPGLDAYVPVLRELAT